MRIRVENIARLEAAKLLTSREPIGITAMRRWHAAAMRIVDVYGPEFNPIAARLEREMVSVKQVEGLKAANRKLKLLRADPKA